MRSFYTQFTVAMHLFLYIFMSRFQIYKFDYNSIFEFKVHIFIFCSNASLINSCLKFECTNDIQTNRIYHYINSFL